MKFAIMFLLFIGISSNSYAQKRPPFCGFNDRSGYFGYKSMELKGIKASSGHKSGIPDVVSEIVKQFDINVDIEIYITNDENNCYATIGKGGTKLLIADYNFLVSVNKKSKTEWAAISVLAHEIGHHIAGFNWHENQIDNELDADYWSGFVLKKLGSSRNAAIKCIMYYGTDTDTDSHPNKHTRAKMIQNGWDDAEKGEIDYSHCEDCEH